MNSPRVYPACPNGVKRQVGFGPIRGSDLHTSQNILFVLSEESLYALLR